MWYLWGDINKVNTGSLPHSSLLAKYSPGSYSWAALKRGETDNKE